MTRSTKFLKQVAYHSREPMVELNQHGVIQNANRVAEQLFKLEKYGANSFSSLKLLGLEGKHFDWEYLINNLSLLPKIVTYSLGSNTTTYLFSLSADTDAHQNEPAYFLVLSPIVGNGNEVETYRVAEEKFYKVFHLSPDAISITRVADGLFIDVNEGFVQLTGYQREELIGNTVLNIGLWNVLPEREKLTNDLLNNGKSFMEASYRIKGGELAEGQINARIITINGEDCLISVVRDLRQQKAVERVLREREEQLKIINRATNDAVWDWNLTSDTLTWNGGMERIFGYKPEQIEPKIQWWEQHIHPEDQQRVMNRIRYFIEKKQEQWFDKYRFLRSDNSYAYVYDKGSILQDENHRVIRMIGGMVDITDRVLAEESLLIRNQQIAEYSFFNSHKVRAPLSRLLGLTHLLQEDLVSDNEQRSIIEKVRLAGEEIDEMIKEIAKIFY
ncbi:PAS domain S-box protein [Tunicatimonas pelagia]|uniref:PAS domain S-box protein n=1 Tax=Tunicatimonas pelagia TaxID=931531 RepID=UPI002665A69F|nr:PAS domain S-box protein [Tunicatimonas pelagia]WKN42699.1 PAS domain S-box protein [Tunicatimonas pelagia]